MKRFSVFCSHQYAHVVSWSLLAQALLLSPFLLAAGCNQRTVGDASQGSSEVVPDDELSAVPISADVPPDPSDAVSLPQRGNVLQPSDLVYRGAVRLPEGSNNSNWEYSGYAMTYYPDGDRDGPDDGFPGSLFAIGHDHHQHVSEISIPEPIVTTDKKLDQLNTAATLQPFFDIRGGMFAELEIPRAGLEYLPAVGRQQTAKLHFAWGDHMESELGPTHGWCELDLSAPRPAGPWQLGHWSRYVTNDYLFEIPEQWAARYTPGSRLATGRFRDGTWSGLGPALLAYGAWAEGQPPAAGATLKNVTPLLMYGEPVDGSLELAVSEQRRMKGFREPDEWSGGAWLVAGDRSAVILIGTKAVGKHWYGFANGVEYPTSGDPSEPVPDVPPWPNDSRGWWSDGVEAQMIFFDAADLAAVAVGDIDPWEPQPYATLVIDKYLFDPGYDHQRQKRYLLGGAAYDRTHNLLYVVERRADEEKSVIHVFQVRGG